jgi:DNA polymerase III delta subunit
MITTLSGSNGFLIKTDLKKRISEFSEKYTDLAVEQIDALEQSSQVIVDALNGLPFLTPKKLVVLYNPSGNKVFSEVAEKVFAELSDTNELIIVETSLDKRSSFYKYLKAKTDFHDYAELRPNQLATWLVETAKSQKATISIGSANYLIEQAGTNQLKLFNELQKLISYDSGITRETIDLLVDPIPQTTIFQLLDAAFNGRVEKISRIYEDQRRQKVEPQQIMSMIVWQVHAIAVVQSAGSASDNEISHKSGLSPFVINKSRSIARSLSLSELRQLTQRVATLDFKLKNKNIDANEAIKYLLFSIAMQRS